MADERQCNECGAKLPADAPQGLCPQCLMKLGLPSEAGGEDHAVSDDQAAIPTSATPPGGFVPPEPEELAKKFPQLEILELLGQGGMGAVYKARQRQLDRLVALKILPPEVGRAPAFAERFAREARSLARLNHPRIVSVFDFGHTEDGLYYFMMEFVDGTDLRRVIEGGQLAPAEALAIVPQICEALQYAHEEGLVHRDIKPENILLDKKGRVKIADFGLAKLLGKPATAYTLTQAGQRMGTPHYMAPEQIEGAHKVDHRADIYSLGVVFYEMLTGQLPIGRFAPPSQKVQVDVRLDNVVLKSLEHEPERRYQHASEVKTDVETIAEQTRPVKHVVQHGEAEAIRQQVKGPAVGLLVTGILNWIGIIVGVIILTPILAKSQQAIPDPKALLWAVALAAIVLSGLIFFAALKMMRLEAYRWVIAGSILAMIVTPGNIVGLPIGIWALVVLTSRKVKEAFPRTQAGDEHGIPAKGRFSRAAIVGACCAPLAIFLLVPALVLTDPKPLRSSEFFTMMRETTGGFVFVILFALVGLAATFGTTILGIVSITHIRQSAGRLYGMGLAVFDALFFPVLALNIVVIGVLLLADMGLPEAIILTLIIGGLNNRFLIRRAWRKANAGLEPVQKHAPETETDAKAQQTQTAQATEINVKEAARRRVRGPAIGLLIVCVVGLLTWPARELFMSWMMNRTFLSTSPIWTLVDFLEYTRVPELAKGLFLIAAASPMLWMRGYRLAVAASIVAMLPAGPSFLPGLPIGIWALAVLTKPEVKAAFAGGRKHGEANGGIGESSIKAAGDGLILIAGVALMVAVGIVLWLIFAAGGLNAEPSRRQTTLQNTLLMMSGMFALYSVFIGTAGIAVRRISGRLYALLSVVIMGVFVPAVLALNVIMEHNNMGKEWMVLIPLWLGMPICLWLATALFRRDTRAMFENAAQADVESAAALKSERRFSRAAPTYADEKGIVPRQVAGAAKAMLAAGIINLISAPVTVLFWIMIVELRLMGRMTPATFHYVLRALVIAQAVAVPIAGVVIAAAMSLKRLRLYGLAVAGGIMLLLPLNIGWLVGLPIGIWALAVLTKQEVKAAFPRKERRGKLDAPTDADEKGAVCRQVSAPAIALFVAGLLTLAYTLALWWAFFQEVHVSKVHVLDPSEGETQLYDWTELLYRIGILSAIPSAVIMVLGAVRMKRLQSRGLALAGAILTFVPFTGFTGPWLITMPIGIWVLSVLGKAEVKAGFP